MTSSKTQHHQRTDKAQDDAVKDSFPASDPPANSGFTGADGDDKPKHAQQETSDKGAIDPQPTGTPTSDRHATETAHHSEPATHQTKKG